MVIENSQSQNCFDVLVVGAGLGGAVTALCCADRGLKVALLDGGESASSWSQGGIVYRGPTDPESLISDIMTAGVFKNFKPAVELLARNASHAVDKWLIERAGVFFDRDQESNNFDFALEAAHREPRILHVKDGTGRAIMEKMQVQIKSHKNIQQFSGALVDLLLSNVHDLRREKMFSPSRVWGAYCFSEHFHQQNRPHVFTIVARETVLATGGFSALYAHSTGPQGNRGDGIAAAHRAGARTLGLEYIQFHPTALYVPGRPRFLLTEALRGKGAKLLNSEGVRFIDELAPRDVVARAIGEEMLKSGAPHVWLDVSPVSDLEKSFPNLVQLLSEEHVSVSRGKIPVVPAAHYTIGGVWTDLKGQTNLDGLWAVGEVACTGVHGANRLASTSLLETVVFGDIVGKSLSKKFENGNKDSVNSENSFDPRPWTYETGAVDPALVSQDWQTLKQTFWNYLGLVRSEKRLKRAERILLELRAEIESFYKKSTLNRDLLSLRHGVLVATLVLYSALRNKASVGTHYLKDEN